MHGQNPKRPPLLGDGLTLDIQEIFPTLQGEGPFAGHPAVFIRLGGCNLSCDFCDTEFESFHPQPLDDILASVQQLSCNDAKERIRTLVVITGGEPFRQPIEALCQALIDGGFEVQVETNGTLFRAIHRHVHIICSPKNTGSGYQPIRPDLLRRLSGVKFIISAHHPLYQDVADIGQYEWAIPTYVQPMDEGNPQKNKANLDHAKHLALTQGYRLSLQIHKIIGIA
ncbi:MAG: 7-carboxy-7-deazaguanine synthase QueE [Alphaproteobacteria bacterium]|nr:7-carboxy-7-deazaguanine synthase QueE [Alphaproteobacteria bacterium]